MSALFSFYNRRLQSKYYGLRAVRGLFIGPTAELESTTGGFLSITFELFIGVFICLFSSASLGIPGIGGVFLGSGLPAVFESVIPGIVADTFDAFILAAFGLMPGAELFVSVTGLPDKPGGIFAEELMFVITTALLFVGSAD